jgi:hypothetical protein
VTFHPKTKDLGDDFQPISLMLFQGKKTSDFSGESWCNGGKKTYF